MSDGGWRSEWTLALMMWIILAAWALVTLSHCTGCYKPTFQIHLHYSPQAAEPEMVVETRDDDQMD